MPEHRVWVVIVDFHGWDDTAECLESLFASKHPPKVVVVDNGQDALVHKKLSDLYPEVDYLRSDGNVGFTKACNAGIRHAMSRGAEFIMLLNNDTVIYPGTLERLARTLNARDRAAAAGPRVVLYDNREVGWYEGGKIGRIRGTVYHTKMRARSGLPVETRFVSGAAMMIKVSALSEVGLLDESFFFGGEDAEFCVRLRSAGLECVYDPEGLVAHKVGRSRGQLSAWQLYNGQITRFLLLKKFGFSYRSAQALAIAFGVLSGVKHTLRYPTRGQLHPRVAAWAIWEAIKDIRENVQSVRRDRLSVFGLRS